MVYLRINEKLRGCYANHAGIEDPQGNLVLRGELIEKVPFIVKGGQFFVIS